MEHYEDTVLGFDPHPPTGVDIFPNKTTSTNAEPVDTFGPLGTNRMPIKPLSDPPAVPASPPPAPEAPPAPREQREWRRRSRHGSGPPLRLAAHAVWWQIVNGGLLWPLAPPWASALSISSISNWITRSPCTHAV
jgi:hypothetical protein